MSSKGAKLPPWYRSDAGMRRNRKVVKLLGRGQHRAIVAWQFGLGWCREELTDGYIPTWALPAIYATDKDAQALVEVGLWEEAPDGWRVHNYERWQDPAEVVTARKAHMSTLAKGRWRGPSPALHLAGGDRP